MGSLWGESFDIKSPSADTKSLIRKAANPKKKVSTESILKSKKTSLEDRLSLIYTEVLRVLGVYKERTQVIKSKQELVEYIDAAIKNGVIAIDTETNNSLDPLTCVIMGGCIYTPGRKNAYIPINHTDLQGVRLSWQCTEKDLKEQFDRLKNVDIIMHNGKFDYQVIKCTCNCKLSCYWDTMICARILNENERAGLKVQYIEKIDPSIEKYSIDHLFNNVLYQYVDPEIFALYAATDSFMTYKLYELQKAELKKPENNKLYSMFMTIEMPLVEVIAEMELSGITIDKEYAHRLSEKYHRKSEEVDKKIAAELAKYESKIAAWRQTAEAQKKPAKKTGNGLGKSKSEQLSDPVEITSPTQLAILLYDVLKAPIIDKKTPRGTGEDILKQMEYPICKLILEKRGVEKLINTYIDKLPQCVSEKDGRLHAHFNQCGTDTGRLSSSDPNLQNIPSHEIAIRMMFTAAPGMILIGSDYSQQEPRLLASYARDEKMIDAYKHGRDLYADIASSIYNNKYEDNKEFYPDGTMNPEGKKRRTSVKSLLLGIMYGMGPASLAEAIHGTIQDAQNIIDIFFKKYPNVKKWIDQSERDARDNGYVEDLWGRRRRLPDIQLEQFELESNSEDFNPLINGTGKFMNSKKSLCESYKKQLMAAKYRRDINAIIDDAAKHGIKVHQNGGFIARAQRQCVNARVQGGAASMSKRAMIGVYKDKELNELGFKLLIGVHDELIGECPIENQEAVKKRLSEIMIDAAKPDCITPMKCDADAFHAWYEDVYSAELKQSYKKLCEEVNADTAFEMLCKNYEECTPEKLQELLNLS